MRLWNWKKDNGGGLPQKVVFGDLERPTVTICPSEPSPAGERFSVPESARAALGDLTIHAAKAFGEVAAGASQTYTLVFSPDVQRGLADGTYSLMESLRGGSRAIALDGSGKIVEHASVRLPGAVNPATLALAAWQILSIVVAQKHLADINARLAKLETGIQTILERMDGDRRAWIRSHYTYLRHVVTILQSGQFVPNEVSTLNGQLEDIERESSRVMLALEGEIEQQLDEFAHLDLRGRKVKQAVSLVQQQMEQFDARAQQYLLALYVRVIAAKVKCTLPVDHSLARLRLEDLDKDLQRQQSREAQFLQTLTMQVPQLGSRLRKWCDLVALVPGSSDWRMLIDGSLTTAPLRFGAAKAKRHVENAQDELENSVRSTFTDLRQRTEHVGNTVVQTRRDVQQRSSDMDIPLALEVTVEGGSRVTSLRRVPLPTGSQA